MKNTKELKPYSQGELTELGKILDLPVSSRKKALDKFCKANKRPTRGAYQKMVKLRQESNTVATVMPKTEPVSMSGRTVEIKGITSISFVGNSLLFKF